MKAKRIISLVLFAALTTAAQSQTTFAQRQQQTNSPNVGLKAFLEGGYAFGESIYSEVPISLLATVGYQINQHFFVGVGSGENFFCSCAKASIVQTATIDTINSRFIFISFYSSNRQA